MIIFLSFIYLLTGARNKQTIAQSLRVSHEMSAVTLSLRQVLYTVARPGIGYKLPFAFNGILVV